ARDGATSFANPFAAGSRSSSCPSTAPIVHSDRVPTGTPRISPALVRWLVALAAVLPLLPTLRAAFVYDDTTIIRDNTLLRGWSALAHAWSAPYWLTTGADVSGLYRPLHVAVLSMLWNVGGGAAWPFHLYSL